MPRYKSSNFEGGFDKVYRVITKEIGLEASAFLGHLINVRDYHKGNGKLFKEEYFFYTSKDIEKYLGLKRKPQERLISKLEQLNFLKLCKWGAPLRIYFAINDEAIAQFIEKASVQKEHYAMSKTDTTYCPKGTLHSVQKEQTISKSESIRSDEFKNKKREALSSSKLSDILTPEKDYIKKCVSMDKVMEMVNTKFKTNNYELNSYWTPNAYRKKLIELKSIYGKDYLFDLERAEIAVYQYNDYMHHAYTNGLKEGLRGDNFLCRFFNKLENYAKPSFELHKGQFNPNPTYSIQDMKSVKDLTTEEIEIRNEALKQL